MKDVREALRHADLGLTKFQIYSIAAEAKKNANKRVAYDQFVPVAARMITDILNRSVSQEEIQQRADAFAAMAAEGDVRVGGMSVYELDRRFLEFFQAYDANGNGYLEAAEFEAALLEAGAELGVAFSEEQLKMLLAAADENEDGKIAYEEFVKLAVALLTELEREKRLAPAGEV